MSTEIDNHGIAKDVRDVNIRESKDTPVASDRQKFSSQQQDKSIDSIKRQLAQGRARGAIEDERIHRTREKVDSMWQSLE